MATSKQLIDVTSLVAVPRYTGVQRVQMEVLDSLPSARKVAFSAKEHDFVDVGDVREFRFLWPGENSWRARLVEKAFRAWAKLSALSKGSAVFRKILRAASTYLVAVLGPSITGAAPNSGKKMAGGHIDFSSSDPADLWLLEIPKSLEHLRFLEAEIDRGGIRLHVLLYDLIPIDQELLLGISPDPVERNLYLSYLKLTTRAETIFFLSKFTAERYQAFLERRRSSLRPNVKTRVLYPPRPTYPLMSLEQATRIAKRLGIDGELPMVLAVAPLNKRKNLIILLESVEELLRRGLDLELVLVSPLTRDVDLETVRTLDKLRKAFPKRIKLVRSISQESYAALSRLARVMAIPSLLEGFGFPVVDGLYNGATVVASRASSFIELAEFLPIKLVSSSGHSEWTGAIKEALASKPSPVNLERLLPDSASFSQSLIEFASGGTSRN